LGGSNAPSHEEVETMRKTIRHVAVLAAAVAMLTTLAVPAQGRGGSKLDLFEVTCVEDTHWVTAVAADESWKEQVLRLRLYRLTTGGYLEIDMDSMGPATGLLEVQVEGSVAESVDSKYMVTASLTTFNKQNYTLDFDPVVGVC
jgi:hypothetical protein